MGALGKFDDASVPLTADAAKDIDFAQRVFAMWALGQRMYNQQEALATLELTVDDSVAALEDKRVGYNVLPYTGQPTNGQTITVGADVYEFRSSGEPTAGRLKVVIGGTAFDTYENFIDTAIQSGTELLFWTQMNDYVIVANADVLHDAGSPVPGTQDIAFAETVTDGGPWRFANLEDSVRASVSVVPTMEIIELDAADITRGYREFPVSFEPKLWQAVVYDVENRVKDNCDLVLSYDNAGGVKTLKLTFNSADENTLAARTGAGTAGTVSDTNHDTHIPTDGQPGRALRLQMLQKGTYGGAALTLDVVKVSAAGVETSWAADLVVTANPDHVPTALTLNGVPLPAPFDQGDTLRLRVMAASGLTGPLEATFILSYLARMVAGDRIVITLAG